MNRMRAVCTYDWFVEEEGGWQTEECDYEVQEGRLLTLTWECSGCLGTFPYMRIL
jgi:hypothetical protein